MSLTLLFPLFLVVGVGGGVLIGLLGVGMALITTPALIAGLPHLGLPPEHAPLVALASTMGAVTIGASASLLAHARRGNVDLVRIRALTFFAVFGMAAGSLLAIEVIPGDALRWLICLAEFGIAWMMLRPNRAKPIADLNATGTPPPHFRMALADRAVTVMTGVAGSLIGAGGGIFLVPWFSRRGMTMVAAVGTSTAIGLPVTLLGVLLYASQPIPPGAEALSRGMLGMLYLPAVAGLGLGGMIGAPLGARWANTIDGDRLRRIFGVALVILGLSAVFG